MVKIIDETEWPIWPEYDQQEVAHIDMTAAQFRAANGNMPFFRYEEDGLGEFETQVFQLPSGQKFQITQGLDAPPPFCDRVFITLPIPVKEMPTAKDILRIVDEIAQAFTIPSGHALHKPDPTTLDEMLRETAEYYKRWCSRREQQQRPPAP